MKLVEAQEGRRILDRLSATRSRTSRSDASARARRRDGCRASRRVSSSTASAPAWRSAAVRTGTSRARSAARRDRASFPATLVDARRQAPRVGPRLRRRHRSARTPNADVALLDEAGAAALADAPRTTSRSRSRRSRPRAHTERPKAPFITSTLQQEAGRKLGFSAARTMHVAQGLYERGLITYMRTDSTSLSEQAVSAARNQIRSMYGDGLPPRPAAPVPQQGEERAGGARGDPPRRRPHAHRRRRRRASSAVPTSAASTTSSGSARSRRRWPTPASGGSPSGSRPRRPAARRPCSRRPAAPSSSPVTCAPTSRAPTTPTPSSKTARRSCPPLEEGSDGRRAASCSRRVTPRNRRRATPRRAW